MKHSILILAFTFLGSLGAQASEQSDAARFPILHNDMGEYWGLESSQAGRSSSAVNSEAVQVTGESGVQNGKGSSSGHASASNVFSNGRTPQNVAPASTAPHRCENGKKKDLPSQASPHSDPAS